MKNHLSFLFCFLFCFYFHANAQIITTIAGNGPGFAGDGGPATAALMQEIWGIARDAIGNVYFSDFENNRVRKIDVAGIISTFAGNGGAYSGDGGPATTAGVNGPTGIVVIGSDVYIAENFSHRIRKVDGAGIISTIAGTGSLGFGGDGGPATAAQITNPNGLGSDLAGNIYIPDQSNRRVRKISTSGIITTIAGNGLSGYTGDGGPATLATMALPDLVMADATGNVYFSDFSNNVVRKISTAGIMSTFAGNGVAGFSGDGGPATAAQLHGPSGVNFDLAGNCYITDANNNRIRMINSMGIITTIAGTGIAGFSGDGGDPLLAKLNSVLASCSDPAGNIYIADMLNRRVRKMTVPFSNTAPAFIGGSSQNLIMCEIPETGSPIPINTYLEVSDPDVGQTETWSLLGAPAHGVAVVSYAAVSTGSTITPVGLTYLPTAGYWGTDAFSVRVSDGLAADTLMMLVTINPQPQAGTITGPSTICKGDTIILIDTSAGGVWTRFNADVNVAGSGTVTGLLAGTDTLYYTVSNSCGIAVARHAVNVTDCHVGVKTVVNSPSFKLFPNPVSGIVNIEWKDLLTREAAVAIKNVTGQVVYTGALKNNSSGNGAGALNLSDLTEGVYIISVTSESCNFTEKLIISRR